MASLSPNASSPSSSSRSASPLASVPSSTPSESSATSSPVSNLDDQRVRAALRKCEKAWEQVLVGCSELNLALVTARQARNFSVVAGHQILSATSKAVALAGDGQSEMANIHRLIERFAKVNGIDTMDAIYAYGDGRKPPEDNVFFGGP